MDRDLVKILSESGCSLVVRDRNGEVTTYSKKGVRDLIWLLDNEPQRLDGAGIADKVIGKAAAGLVINAKVKSLYAEVLSKKAIPFLDKAQISYSFNTITEKITIPEGDSRCRLEEIVEKAANPAQIEEMLRAHFKEMRDNNSK